MKEEEWKTTEKIMTQVREKAPLIHCITNPISIHDCANVILAAGARPIMAEHPKEVREITAASAAAGLNLGNITDARKASILLSGEEAVRCRIPVVLDLVGIGCSAFRREIVRGFFRMCEKKQKETGQAPMLVLKGNISEIRVLAGMETGYQLRTSGVDNRREDVVQGTEDRRLIQEIAALAGRHQAVVMATGKTDVISDGEQTFLVKNGCEKMASVTGTGCMLTALCAAFLSERRLLEGALLAAVTYGICGERAAKEWRGCGTYQIRLMDELSECTPAMIESQMRVQKLEKAF